jgi:threonylcarbamoyladenosine tRNA methylthiotransferase MtaB
VVIGCSVQNDPEALSSIKGVELVLGNIEKENLISHLTGSGGRASVSSIKKARLVHYGPCCGVPEKTRANLKVQDGCDQFCSYCIVPYVRGASRSEKPARVLSEAKRLVETGYRELVLTGIHIGQYKKDGIDFTRLLKKIVSLPGNFRVRISSINPDEMDGEFLGLVLSNPRICRHLHISMQHAYNPLLERMGRPYTAERIRKIFEKIRRADPLFGLGTDLLVGFPGEDQRAFRALYKTVKELPLTYGHVFRFSPKKGTKAAGMGPKVPEPVKIKRSLALRKLLEIKRSEFMKKLVGKNESILFESNRGSGYISNYVKFKLVSESKDIVNGKDLMQVRITGARKDHVVGIKID